MPPQGGGLFGNLLGGYDLGSHLQIAGAYLDGQPGAALQMAQQMEQRKIAKEVARQRYDAAKVILSKNKDLIPLYNADPEGFMTYYTKMTFDEMVADKASQEESKRHVRDRQEKLQDEISKNAYTTQNQQQGHRYAMEEQAQGFNNQKDMERFKATMDPNQTAHRGLMEAIQERAKKIQAPGAGQVAGAVDPSTLASRQILNDPNLSQTEASQLMMSNDPSAAINSITDNRNNAVNSKIQAYTQAVNAGLVDPKTTSFMDFSSSGGNTGQRQTEQTIRGQSLLAGVQPAIDLADSDFKSLKDNSVKLQVKRSGIPMMNQIMQGNIDPQAQMADLKLSLVARLSMYAMSGQAVNQVEFEKQLDSLYPLQKDDPKTVAGRQAVYKAMLETIKTQAQAGVAKNGQPLPQEFYSGVQQLGTLAQPSPGGFSKDDQDRLKKYGISP